MLRNFSKSNLLFHGFHARTGFSRHVLIVDFTHINFHVNKVIAMVRKIAKISCPKPRLLMRFFTYTGKANSWKSFASSKHEERLTWTRTNPEFWERWGNTNFLYKFMLPSSSSNHEHRETKPLICQRRI